MQSNTFRRNQIERDKEDTLELEQKIALFRKGKIDEEKFKLYRLTRGVYGQRQFGVHMFRTKLPLGKISSDQLRVLADISEEFATGNLHLTTRQNIQFHYVKLEDSPKIWERMSDAGMNAREACGNTVRNVTCSSSAGIDPDEPFDVSPYALALYQHFLRNPFCQEMGRKIKISFSSSDKDSAYGFFHDFGFIPKIQNGKHGFKVLIGGGLGAQSIIAHTAYEFLAADLIIPFVEGAVRVFDRLGEREKRFKARLKFLLKALGLERFLQLVKEEMTAVSSKVIPIDTEIETKPDLPARNLTVKQNVAKPEPGFDAWKRSNTFLQKGNAYYSVQLKVRLGDIKAPEARKLAKLVKKYAADDIRITVNQGFLLRYILEEDLVGLYNELLPIDLGAPGFASITDVTACPGTDTCNLGVSNSTALSNELEKLVLSKYPELIFNKDIYLKISGCMNSCGQHMASPIGFHGSSYKVGNKIAPALQVLLGGGVDQQGQGLIGEKIIKVPTKKAPEVLTAILDEYFEKRNEAELFNEFYYRFGRRYFYNLLKPLVSLNTLTSEDFEDWGQNKQYIQAIGIGECAGASLDLVSTILDEASIRLDSAQKLIDLEDWTGSIYQSYSVLIIGAKALLLSEDIKCNTHISIISDFQKHFVESGKVDYSKNFTAICLSIKNTSPSSFFANEYVQQARRFLKEVYEYRLTNGQHTLQEKQVLSAYYKA